MIGKTHRPKRPGRRSQLPGDDSLYRQVNISELRAMSFDLPKEGRSKLRVKATERVVRLGKSGKSSLKKGASLGRNAKASNKLSLTPQQRDLANKLKAFNKTFLILTLVIMLYDLTGQASAAEAPSSAGEIVTMQSSVALVKHDPVNFDQTNPQETKPNVDSGIQPAAAGVVGETVNKDVTAVDDSIVSADVPPVVEAKPAYNAGGIANQFTYGYCTWYVASKRPVPWNGNAIVWYSQAIAYGFKVGNTPAPGAIMVTSESSLGHVAYVESVNTDGSWVVSEMNYVGWGIISSRTIRPGTIPVIGFIY